MGAGAGTGAGATPDFFAAVDASPADAKGYAGMAAESFLVSVFEVDVAWACCGCCDGDCGCTLPLLELDAAAGEDGRGCENCC